MQDCCPAEAGVFRLRPPSAHAGLPGSPRALSPCVPGASSRGVSPRRTARWRPSRREFASVTDGGELPGNRNWAFQTIGTRDPPRASCAAARAPVPRSRVSLRLLPCLSPETLSSTLRWKTMTPTWGNSGLPRNCHIRTQLTLLSNRNPGVGSAQLPQSPPRGGIFIFLILRYQRMTWISA